MIRNTMIMVIKDLRLFLRDKVALMLAVLLPIVLVTVFCSIMTGMGGGNGGMPSIEVALLDQDQSPASNAFVAAFGDMQGISLVLAEPASTRDDLVRLVHDGQRPFAVLLPEGFAAGSELELIRDPGRSMSLQILSIGLVRALFETRGEELLWEIQSRSLEAAGIPAEWTTRIEAFTTPFRQAMKSLFTDAAEEGHVSPDAEADGEDFDFQQFALQVLPIQTQDVLPSGRQEQITYMVSHSVSGMTVMMIMFSLVGFARTLLEERKDGTMRRLLCAPINPLTVLMSKFLGAFMVGMCLVFILFAYAALVFDFSFLPHWDTVLVISLATVASSTAFALLIAVVSTSDKQADGLSTILILVMSALGGAWMPLMFMPEAVRTVGQFTLTYWSIEAYQSVFWSGLHWTNPTILKDLGVLLGLAVVLVFVAARVFQRRRLSGFAS